MLNNKRILLTGGTGSFGKKFVELVFSKYKVKEILIFSRDELKQFEMRQIYPTEKYPITYKIGDIRDKERIYRVCFNIDIIIHAAALKQVPTAEYNPFEAVKTNINGAQNIIEAALDNKVLKVIALSTDKACSPINLYGATKLTSDKLFAAANDWNIKNTTQFSVVRYGNVVGSRGSVIPFFYEKKKEGVLPLTDKRMTRFWITLEQGVNFVITCLSKMCGGELVIPKIPSMKIIDLAKTIAPKAKIEIIGIRPGEKIHEVMISTDDALNTIEFENYYVIQPSQPWWDNKKYIRINGGKNVNDNFIYSSEKNLLWLTNEKLNEMLKQFNYAK